MNFISEDELQEFLEVLIQVSGAPEQEEVSREIDKKKEYQDVVTELYHLYVEKNEEYGDSVGHMYDKSGLTPLLYQIQHKLSRAITVAEKDNIKFESLEDTLRDLACYAVISYMEYKLHNRENNDEKEPSTADVVGAQLGMTLEQFKEQIRDLYDAEEKKAASGDELADITARRQAAEDVDSYSEICDILHEELSKVLDNTLPGEEYGDILKAMAGLTLAKQFIEILESEV